MKRAKKKIIYWSAGDIRTLHRLAGRKSARDIARQLGRTEVAVRLKASQAELSLRLG